jgi:Tfp pilus assembly protein PilF
LESADREARALLALALEQAGHADDAAAERELLSRSGSRVLLPKNPTAADLARFDRIRMRLDLAALRPAGPAQPPPSPAAEAAETLRGSQRVTLHLERGRQFLASGKLDDAQRAFIEALLLAPLEAAAHVGLAEVYTRQGRPNDGVREYRAALASRDDSATHVALAQVLFDQNRLAEARAELQKALSLKPNNSEAQQLLDRLESKAGSGGPR